MAATAADCGEQSQMRDAEAWESWLWSKVHKESTDSQFLQLRAQGLTSKSFSRFLQVPLNSSSGPYSKVTLQAVSSCCSHITLNCAAQSLHQTQGM